MKYGWVVALALAATACGSEGGELREATERRRAELAKGDSAADTAAAPRRIGEGDEYEVPAFADAPAPGAAPAGDTTPAAAPAPPGAPPQEWTAGRRAVERPNVPMAVLTAVRSAANQGYDRVVMEFAGGEIPGYSVEYVDRPVHQCGSGHAVEVTGDGILRIRLRQTQAHDDGGTATVPWRERLMAHPIVREIEFICDFEGEVEIVLGVSSPNRFRVIEVREPAPARLVVDVQQ